MRKFNSIQLKVKSTEKRNAKHQKRRTKFHIAASRRNINAQLPWWHNRIESIFNVKIGSNQKKKKNYSTQTYCSVNFSWSLFFVIKKKPFGILISWVLYTLTQFTWKLNDSSEKKSQWQKSSVFVLKLNCTRLSFQSNVTFSLSLCIVSVSLCLYFANSDLVERTQWSHLHCSLFV